MKANGKPYKGKLTKPIVLPDYWARKRKIHGEQFVPYLSPSAHMLDDVIRAEGERERIPKLFDHFEIAETHTDAWRQLALALARRHVPGFGTKRRRGAPVTRTVYAQYLLYMLARRKRNALARTRNSVLTDRQVCEALAKDKDFQRQLPAFANLAPKSLANELVKAKQLRRASIEFRLDKRATLRRMGGLTPEEISAATEGLVGDGLLTGKHGAKIVQPQWPGHIHPAAKKAFKKPSQ